jgi:hypothetical protein
MLSDMSKKMGKSLHKNKLRKERKISGNTPFGVRWQRSRKKVFVMYFAFSRPPTPLSDDAAPLNSLHWQKRRERRFHSPQRIAGI